jgi:hypothetical protein
MKLSITLPSLYEGSLVRTLQSIKESAGLPPEQYEVIVSAPEDILPLKAMPDGIQIKYVPEAEPKGPNWAHHLCAKAAEGEFIFAMVDDHLLSPNWDLIAINRYQTREQRHPNTPLNMGLRVHRTTWIGVNFGLYYPYFPFMRRDYVKSIGWLGYSYRVGFGDSDLALRVWTLGGHCEFLPHPLLWATEEDSQRKKASHTKEDFDTFLERWMIDYGANYDCRQINGFIEALSIGSVQVRNFTVELNEQHRQRQKERARK